MPRKRQVSPEDIKRVARQQMSTHGTAGLSLRAIARELNITAPAIYNYFPRLEDLITALIVDAFNALADHMHAAADAPPAEDTVNRVRAFMLAYREWALQNPTDFQLIYGNPIPGYAAPVEVTAPLARRPFVKLFEIMREAISQETAVNVPPTADISDTVREVISGWNADFAFDLPAPLLHRMIGAWARIHGLVMLELFHHLGPIVGDTAAFYADEVERMLGEMLPEG